MPSVQLSSAVANPVAPGSVDCSQSTVTFGGHMIVGAAVSIAVIF